MVFVFSTKREEVIEMRSVIIKLLSSSISVENIDILKDNDAITIIASYLD